MAEKSEDRQRAKEIPPSHPAAELEWFRTGKIASQYFQSVPFVPTAKPIHVNRISYAIVSMSSRRSLA